jgi:hypothetical protein
MDPDHVAREMQSAEFAAKPPTYATDAGTIAALHVIPSAWRPTRGDPKVFELPHGGKRSPQLGPLHTREQAHAMNSIVGLENEFCGPRA